MSALFFEHVAAAVNRCAGGVQIRNALFEAGMQQNLGVFVVVLHHKLAVPLGGG